MKRRRPTTGRAIPVLTGAMALSCALVFGHDAGAVVPTRQRVTLPASLRPTAAPAPTPSAAPDAAPPDSATAEAVPLGRAAALTPEAAIAEAQRLHARGDLAAAIRVLQTTRIAQPDMPRIEWMLGRLYAETGSARQAEASFRKATLLDTQFGEAWTDLAAILERRGAWRDALLAANRAVAILPSDAGVHADRAIIRYQLGQLDAAIGDAIQATQIGPPDADQLTDHALMRLTRGREGDAEEATLLLGKARMLAPLDDMITLAWAQSMLAAGRDEPAAATYEMLLARNPRTAWASYGRGLCAFRAGDHDRARESGRAARMVLPDQFTATAYDRRAFFSKDDRAYLTWLDDSLKPAAATVSAPMAPLGTLQIQQLMLRGDCTEATVRPALETVSEPLAACYGDAAGLLGVRFRVASTRAADIEVTAPTPPGLDTACVARVLAGVSFAQSAHCVVEARYNRAMGPVPMLERLPNHPRPPTKSR
ncbi:MAG: tetratricopeptide repeat protein [Myxococcota bacterium]